MVMTAISVTMLTAVVVVVEITMVTMIEAVDKMTLMRVVLVAAKFCFCFFFYEDHCGASGK